MSATAHPLNSFWLTHDAATGRLLGRWPAFVEEAPLRTHYTDLLAAACAHGNCHFWLLDMHARNWSTPAFRQWYRSAFAEAAHAALRQPLFMAYVLNPAHQALLDTADGQAMQRACAVHSVYPFFFDSEAAAHEWLAHQQAHA